MKKIYLDSNVLVCFYSEQESDRNQKQATIDAFEVLSQLKDTQLCTSFWTITEVVKSLTLKAKIDPLKVSKIENELINEARFLGIKIHYVDVSPRKDYDFREFFYNIRQGILEFKSDVTDTIHGVIMKNNN